MPNDAEGHGPICGYCGEAASSGGLAVALADYFAAIGDGVNFGTNASNAALLGFCAAFQSGFFWQSVLGAIPVVGAKRPSGTQVLPAHTPAVP